MEEHKVKKSKLSSELQKAQVQFDKFDQEIKEMTVDRMNQAPKEDIEPQTKLSQKQIERAKDVYLKPSRSIASREKFNEDYREQYNFKKEYVQFIAEHRELSGENIEVWTKPFAGMPAEFWEVPTNKPIWGPRYLAERIKACTYHRLRMDQSIISGSDNRGQYYGTIAVDSVVQRLDAMPVNQKRSIFMSASNF